MRWPTVASLLLVAMALLTSSTTAHLTTITDPELARAASACTSRLPSIVHSQRRLVHALESMALNKRDVSTASQAMELASRVSASSCVADTEVVEGPYYIHNEWRRNDLREDQDGTPLILDFTVIDVNTCEVLPNAALELWHTNASGYYGGFTGYNPDTGALASGAACLQGSGTGSAQGGPGNFPPGFTRPPGGPGNMPPGAPGNIPPGFTMPPGGPGSGSMGTTACMTDYSTWLRGWQLTDSYGSVQMITNFPGFYSGRTPHIHLLIQTGGTVTASGKYDGGMARHFGQLFFNDTTTTKAFTYSPYLAHTLVSDWIRVGNDGIYQSANIAPLNLVAIDDDDWKDGMLASVHIFVNSTAVRSVSSSVSVAPSVSEWSAGTTTNPASTTSTPASVAVPASTPAPVSTDTATSNYTGNSHIIVAFLVITALVIIALVGFAFLKHRQQEAAKKNAVIFVSPNDAGLQSLHEEL